MRVTPYEKRAKEKWDGRFQDKDGRIIAYRRWTAPATPYPISDAEAENLKEIVEAVQALPRYEDLEADAVNNDTLVTLPFDIDGVAFQENTAHQTVSVETKSTNASYEIKNWRLRHGTIDALCQRLLDGYAVSPALCDRFGPYIRRGALWYGAWGVILDCDEFRTDKKTDRPDPVYSRDAFFEQYPLMQEYAAFLMPSASSLMEGKPFKARAVIPFPEKVTDKRLFYAIGDHLCSVLPFLPQHVTKNPVVVAFGAKHQAKHAWRGDGMFPPSVLDRLKAQVRETEKQRKATETDGVQARQQKEQNRLDTVRLRSQLQARGVDVPSTEMREPISTFIETVDPVKEMVKWGWLTLNTGNEYHWKGGSTEKSCEIDDDFLKIFSNTMAAASPKGDNAPINAHRFCVWNLYQLDMTKETDKHALRCNLADDGYGTHPDVWQAEQARLRDLARSEGIHVPRRAATVKLSKIGEPIDASELEIVRTLQNQQVLEWEKQTRRKKGQLLIFSGAAGTGKSTLTLTDF